MSLRSLSLVGPTLCMLCGQGMERPPTGVGLLGVSGPLTLPSVSTAPLEGWPSLEGRSLGFHLPCSFLGKKAAGSVRSQKSFVPTACGPAAAFTLTLCKGFCPSLHSCVHRFQTSDKFCVGVCEQRGVEIASEG